jgi:EAL and modified HD-GYP domain-containing signal transduction protein
VITQPNLDPREGVYVARQPILQVAGSVFGYELLYRADATATSCRGSRDLAAARVLNDAVLTLGLERLTGGRRAFVNVTRQLLLSDLASLLPAPAVVLEVLEDVEVDAEVIAACRHLRDQGYAIALDDFVPGSGADALLPFAKYVKLDVLALSSSERRRIQRSLPPTIVVVAEKVETEDAFREAQAAGCTLFQGYYFCKPATFTAGAVSARRLAYARLLSALNRPGVGISEIEDLIKHDASLTVRVLRCINSAAFGIRREVTSIRQALVLLGLDQIRKWASVWALAGLNEGASFELVTMAILRARSCELLAQDLKGADGSSEYFLLGLCSLLEGMLGIPLAEAVDQLPLSDTVRKALIGEGNGARCVLDAVIAYERGEWDEAEQMAVSAGIAPDRLPLAYADALKWARELSMTTAAA